MGYESHMNQNSDHSNDSRRILKIAGISGGVFDRFRSIQDLAKDPSIHGKQSGPI